MKIRSIMTKHVISVSPETKITQVAEMLSEHRIHGVPVLENNHLVGIITETNFFAKDMRGFHIPTIIEILKNSDNAGKDLLEKSVDNVDAVTCKTAKDIMTKECITVGPDDEVSDLIALIRDKDIYTVPVAIGDNVVGIVTVPDVLKIIFRALRRQEDIVGIIEKPYSC